MRKKKNSGQSGVMPENGVASLKKLSDKRQVAYTWLNFIILMVVFVTAIIIIVTVSIVNYYDNLKVRMNEVSDQLVNLPPQVESSLELPINLLVLYYNPNGELIKGYGNGGGLATHVADVGLMNTYYNIVVGENSKVKILTKQMKDGNFVKVCEVVDAVDDIFRNLLLSVSIFVPIVTIILFLVSLALAHNQVKPYQKALDSSLTFTSNVSHELNTPLSIVKANLENVLSEDSVGVYSQQIVSSISEVDRLKRLTEQLLLLSRSDNKRLIYIFRMENPKALLDNIIEPYTYLAEQQGKELNVYFGANLDNKYLLDKDLFHQIMVALLDNSIKYTVAGEKISVHAKVQRGKFYLTVSDNGVGVADDELEKIFVRFYRSEKSRTTSGTGLGLPIVHAIVASLGGKIVASNISPRGFSISVTLPFQQREDEHGVTDKKNA